MTTISVNVSSSAAIAIVGQKATRMTNSLVKEYALHGSVRRFAYGVAIGSTPATFNRALNAAISPFAML
jgi:hypothetical protein